MTKATWEKCCMSFQNLQRDQTATLKITKKLSSLQKMSKESRNFSQFKKQFFGNRQKQSSFVIWFKYYLNLNVNQNYFKTSSYPDPSCYELTSKNSYCSKSCFIGFNSSFNKYQS